MKDFMRGNYLFAFLTMLFSGLGLFLARSIVVGIVVAMPTIIHYFDDLLLNTPSDILGFESLIPVLPVCLLIIGIFLGIAVAVFSVQIFFTALNSVRILNGNGEAVKGIVINLPFSGKTIVTKHENETKEKDQ